MDQDRELQLLTVKEVSRLVSYHPASIYRRVRENTFPSGFLIGPNRRVWRHTEIEAWINDQSQGGERSPPPDKIAPTPSITPSKRANGVGR